MSDSDEELLNRFETLLDSLVNCFAEFAERLQSRPEPQLTGFRKMAADAGYPDKRFYTLAEVAAITGIPRSAVDRARRELRLAAELPQGCKRGYLTAPEWVDTWLERMGER